MAKQTGSNSKNRGRGRPSVGDDVRTRTQVLLSPAESRAIAQAAKAVGESKSAFIRQAALSRAADVKAKRK